MEHSSINNLNVSQTQQISVVVNVWGGDDALCFRRSMSSIAGQSRRPDEVIIVVDGPISNELEIAIQNFQQQNTLPTKVIDIPIQNGLWNARNIGVRATAFEFVALHDADDVMHPKRLQIQLTEMKRLSVDVCFTSVVEFNTKNGEIIGCRVNKHEVVDVRAIFWNNILSHSSAMFKRDVIIGIGGYRNVYFSEDYDLWLRLIISGKRIGQSKLSLQALGIDSGHLNRRGGLRFVKSENSIHQILRGTHEFSSITLLIRKIIRLSYRLGPELVRQTHRRQLNSRKICAFPTSITEFLDANPVDSGLR